MLRHFCFALFPTETKYSGHTGPNGNTSEGQIQFSPQEHSILLASLCLSERAPVLALYRKLLSSVVNKP